MDYIKMQAVDYKFTKISRNAIESQAYMIRKRGAKDVYLPIKPISRIKFESVGSEFRTPRPSNLSEFHSISEHSKRKNKRKRRRAPIKKIFEDEEIQKRYEEIIKIF